MTLQYLSHKCNHDAATIPQKRKNRSFALFFITVIFPAYGRYHSGSQRNTREPQYEAPLPLNVLLQRPEQSQKPNQRSWIGIGSGPLILVSIRLFGIMSTSHRYGPEAENGLVMERMQRLMLRRFAAFHIRHSAAVRIVFVSRVKTYFQGVFLDVGTISMASMLDLLMIKI